jgi:hypothetical protein
LIEFNKRKNINFSKRNDLIALLKFLIKQFQKEKNVNFIYFLREIYSKGIINNKEISETIICIIKERFTNFNSFDDIFIFLKSFLVYGLFNFDLVFENIFRLSFFNLTQIFNNLNDPKNLTKNILNLFNEFIAFLTKFIKNDHKDDNFENLLFNDELNTTSIDAIMNVLQMILEFKYQNRSVENDFFKKILNTLIEDILFDEKIISNTNNTYLKKIIDIFINSEKSNTKSNGHVNETDIGYSIENKLMIQKFLNKIYKINNIELKYMDELENDLKGLIMKNEINIFENENKTYDTNKITEILITNFYENSSQSRIWIDNCLFYFMLKCFEKEGKI